MDKLAKAFSWKRIAETLGDPGNHPRELSLIIGMTVLFVFALIVLFALFFVRTKREKKKRSGGDVRPVTNRELVWLMVFLGWLVLLGFGASFILAASPTFCLSCHGSSQVAKDLKSSVHAKLACQSCHQTPGLVGAVAYRLEVGRMVVGQIMGQNANAAGSASRDACLSCHEQAVSKTIIAKSIRVEHKVPIAKGYRCEQCHYRIAHNEPKRSNAMSVCYDCHGKGKKLKCSACHVNWAGMTNYQIKNYTKVTLKEEIACEKCHETQSECVSCHKLRMPHTAEWERSGHALKAATDRKLCLECHEMSECTKCHPGLPGPHKEGFMKEHGTLSKNPQANCSGCHPQVQCLSCHEDVHTYKVKALPDG